MLPQRRRAWVVWGLATGGLMAVVMMAGVVCWFRLPAWAPYWVIDHSPFIEPVVRALVIVSPPPTGTPESTGGPPFVLDRIVSAEDEARGQRLKKLAAGAIPFLEHCLDGGDRGIRLQALDMLNWHHLPANAQLQVLMRDPDPWMRLNAWNALRWRADGNDDEPPTIRDVVDGVAHAAMALLDDRDGYIREQVRDHLADQVTLSWPVRIDLYSRIRQPSERERFVPLLETLFKREEGGEPMPQLPGALLFPLLSLAQVDDGDAHLRELVAAQLPRVEQNFDALLVQLTAMQRGARPCPPGAEPWMAERLRLLTEQRISLSLREADLMDVVAKHFAPHNVLIDQHVIAAAPPPVTLDLTEVRLIDALLALAKATGTRMHLTCDAVLLVYPSDFSGFAPPLPAIRIATGIDPTTAVVKSRLNELQRRFTTPAGDPPIVQILAELSRQSGIPITVEGGVIEPEWTMWGSRLHQVSLEHLLRLIAWYNGVQVELGASGIRFFAAPKQ